MWESHPRLTEIPSDERLGLLAQAVGTALIHATPDTRPDAIATALNWHVEVEPLGDAAIESLLVPMRRGGFDVIVNSQRRPTDARMTWLMCHEIGHSLFWRPGTPPRRIVPPRHGEEVFCDKFADYLFGVMDTQRSARVA